MGGPIERGGSVEFDNRPIIFYGPNNSGKSTTIRVLDRILAFGSLDATVPIRDLCLLVNFDKDNSNAILSDGGAHSSELILEKVRESQGKLRITFKYDGNEVKSESNCSEGSLPFRAIGNKPYAIITISWGGSIRISPSSSMNNEIHFGNIVSIESLVGNILKRSYTQEDLGGKLYLTYLEYLNDIVTGGIEPRYRLRAVGVTPCLTDIYDNKKMICNEEFISTGIRQLSLIASALSMARILSDIGEAVFVYIDTAEFGLHVDYLSGLFGLLSDEEYGFPIIMETHNGLIPLLAIKKKATVYVFKEGTIKEIKSINELSDIDLFEEEHEAYMEVSS